MCLLSHVRLFAIPWTILYIAHQAPLSMEFSKQEYWSGLPFPPPGDLPDSGIGPAVSYISCIGRWFFLPLSKIGSKFNIVPDSIYYLVERKEKVAQSCPTLCDPMDCSLPGSSTHGILQARILEWVAISFSNAWKRIVKVKSVSRVRLFATPWTVAHQVPPSMQGKSTGVGCHFLLQGIFSTQGLNPGLPHCRQTL